MWMRTSVFIDTRRSVNFILLDSMLSWVFYLHSFYSIKGCHVVVKEVVWQHCWSDKTEHGSHTYSHTPDWLGSGKRPKEISWGSLETHLHIVLYCMCVCVSTLWPHFRDRSRRTTHKGFVEETRSEKRCVKREGKGAEGCCLKALDSREGGGGSRKRGRCVSVWVPGTVWPG